ncbi:hypothetical protein KSD_17140 [Ktedonobacter sp. SOSP1-85]|nr:hypothetical protein KSD_17140 [Ktedonobacter sp. SOSP1-85]
MHSKLQDACRAEALKEALDRHYLAGELSFFVSQSALVEAYEVHVAIGIPTNLLVEIPRLVTREKDYTPITSSLVSSAVSEILAEATKALHGPEPGSVSIIERTSAEMARSAAQRFVWSMIVLSTANMPILLYDALNEIATMRYERREGLGRMLLASRNAAWITRKFTLNQPVNLRQHRTVRKLLELSGVKGLALLTDGQKIYGLGSLEDGYDPTSESVFFITIIGQGTWEIYHCEQCLLHVQYGRPMLPHPRLDREHFIDIAERVFKDAEMCNATILWELAQAAAHAEHGTMLIVSADAAGEARRLSAQAIVIDAVPVTANDIGPLTAIDGAVLVDPKGMMHAIGVILDGVATEVGDPSRGSRYNSAVRYLGTSEIATLIILVSEDGMINVLPDLPRRISRQELQDLIANLQDEAKKVGENGFNLEKFNKFYDRLKNLSFYLSSTQCDVINELRRRVDDWLGNTNNMRIIYQELQPYPGMNDSYFLDEL